MESSEQSEATITVVCRPCVVCDRSAEVEVPQSAVEALRTGASVQSAWPEADAGTRELLISGTHPECWEALTGGEEDD